MKRLGGFFELELPHGGTQMHPQAYALNTGRACMMVMLEHLRPKRVHVPFYTCDATLHPFSRLGIETRSYALDETLFPIELPALDEGEYILWTDYFGVCGRHTDTLKERYGEKLLLDDTHAFFRSGHTGYWSFTSARKYFGVPDGAYLYSPARLDIRAERFKGISLRHSVLRRLDRQSEAYEAYKEYERSLDCSVYRISEISEGLLSSVDLPGVMDARRCNFAYLHSVLGQHNQLALRETNDVPFCYPYLPSRKFERERLYAEEIFVPTLWPDVSARDAPGYEFEKHFSMNLLPLPIDHRYNPDDLQRMADCLVSAL